MAGSDTFRGITFQAAYAVGLALDVLEGKGEILVLEGSEDVVDAGILGADREPILTVQAKTKVEPHSWAPGELARVLRSWLATGPPVTSRFEFASDGALGPGVVEHLRPALLRMREGILGPEDRAYLRKHNLDSANKALGRVTIKSRLPGGRELLESAGGRAPSRARVRQIRGGWRTGEEAEVGTRPARPWAKSLAGRVGRLRQDDDARTASCRGIRAWAIADLTAAAEL